MQTVSHIWTREERGGNKEQKKSKEEGMRLGQRNGINEDKKRSISKAVTNNMYTLCLILSITFSASSKNVLQVVSI